MGLEAHHQQLKYYKTHFNFIVSTCTIGVGTYCICKTYVPLIYVMATTHFMYPVYLYLLFTYKEPVRVLLGEWHVWKGRGAKRRCVSKEDHVIYIPVLETLQGLLKNEAILSEV